MSSTVPLYSKLLSLATTFLKIGFVFFGGGFVLIPVMQRELVTNLHWLSAGQFVDGTAISQLTPGPIAVIATFTGYRIAGLSGALVATAAVFLPGSALMLVLSSRYDKLRSIQTARRVLDALIPVIVGLLIAASLQIGRGIVVGWIDVAIAVLALVALIRFKTNPALVIGVGALVGILRYG